MLIIHTSYAENKFFLWGERSFAQEEIMSFTEKQPGITGQMPWNAAVADVLESLKQAGIRFGRKTTADIARTAYLMLPMAGDLPIPSSPLLGDIPDASGEASAEIVKMDVLPVLQEELISVLQLLNENREKLSVPGLLFSDDVKFVAKSLEYAALMVYRGTYLPDMEMSEAGYVSVWKPLYLAKYQEEYNLYLHAMPDVMRGVSLSASVFELSDREITASSILETLLDGIVRRAQYAGGTRGKQIDQTNPHEIWLRSLMWPKAPLDRWDKEMGLLYPQIQAWADSVNAVSRQPWRLFLKLEEPVGDLQEGKWVLSWHLQSVKDPNIIIPASQVWNPGPAEKRWFETVGANPRRYLLRLLGQIAPSVPAIARELEKQCPAECSLPLEELFEFLHDHLPGILDLGIQVQFPASWGSLSDRPKLAVRGVVTKDVSYSAGTHVSLTDLLDIEWSVSLGEDILTEEELNMIAGLKTPLANIRGKWVLVYSDELDQIRDGLSKLPRKLTRRDALLASFSESRGDVPISGITSSSWLDSVRSILSGTEQMKEYDQPDGFIGKLRPYQKKGLSWLACLTKLGLGGCLADDMGLGKTIQALALIKKQRLEGECRPVLLICPTSVIENWRREAEKFVPDIPVMIHHGAKRLKTEKFKSAAKNYAIIVSSYSLLYRDNGVFKETEWSGVILDEAQNIKNPDTRQARSARTLTADWHLALTGTPVENHVGDMWSIMEFLMPGLLPNRTRFYRDFLYPIQAGDINAMQTIKRMTGPFILRRLKTDKTIIADLPEKIETEVFCPLCREQALLYESVLKQLGDGLEGTDGIARKGRVLAAITSLKQVCNHPALYLKDHSQLAGRSGKLARLTEIAEEMLAVGDRALIFTQYSEMGAMLKNYLQETFGREVLFLHGAVERKKRDQMVRKFQESNDSPPFFVLSLKAGGTGLNLTGANHVIMFDRWWNPAVEQQAVDRAYRIGQKNSVQVHYFCCRGTLEEKIETLIKSKKYVAEAVVGSGEGWLSELSDDELRRLFALSRDAVEDIG